MVSASQPLPALTLLALTCAAEGAVYLHSPRGSNNKLNEPSNSVANPQRLFDSQNAERGGYQVGDACSPTCSDGMGFYDANADGAGKGQMYFYEGSSLEIQWTMAHGCGHANPSVHCNVVLQYMCEDSAAGLRDGSTTERVPMTQTAADDAKYGLHEPLQYYEDCAMRSRNKGLYVADQELAGDVAIYTRQNPSGTRSGFECAEERDYYPYWHPTPWRDIAILTDDTGRCNNYLWNSQNVRDYGHCCDKVHLQDTGKCRQLNRTAFGDRGPNNFAACEADHQKGTWVESGKWGIDPPLCKVAPYTRDNQLTNTVSPYGVYESQELHPTHFVWKVPGDVLDKMGAEEATCVMRIRYNVSSGDYDNWKTTSLFNGDNAKLPTNPTADFIGFSHDSDVSTDFSLKLSVDSSKVGHTFEDRSHTFLIRRKPSSGECKGASIHNLNVKGRRGDAVQVYPSVPYDFSPSELAVWEGDCVHFQWTGSDANPLENTGNGRNMTDRTNLVEVVQADSNVPARHGFAEITSGSDTHTRYTSMFADEATVRRMAYLNQELDCVSADNCVPSLACDNSDFVDHSIANCMVLNAAPAYFDGGLIRLDRPGVYAFISTRNNAFGVQTQKGLLIVQAWKLSFIIGGSIGGFVLIVLIVLLLRWWIGANAEAGKAQGPLSQGFLYGTNACFDLLENSVLFRHPYTIALLIACCALWAVGYWQALDDGDPAPFYPYAKGHGRCLDILCNLIFLPVLRNLSSWLRTTPMGRVLPVDDNLYFHKLIGLLVAFSFTGHITFHYIDFIWHSTTGSGKTLISQLFMNWTGISGHLILLCMTLMMLTGIEKFRRQRWGIPLTKFKFSGHSLFVRIHKLWAVLLVLLWSHSTAFWQYSLFAVVLLVIDKLIGRLRGRKQVEMVAAHMPARDVLHITMRPTNGRRFKFQAGQYLFLHCPAVSKTEWHPFTISSSPWEATFSVHIKCRKDMDWAYGIRQLLTAPAPPPDARASLEDKFARSNPMASNTTRRSETELHVGREKLYVDGPYGTSSEKVFHFQVMMLVAAGVGVTPFASILKTLAFQAKNGVLETPLKKVAFYWTCRNEDEFNSFKEIMVGICEDAYLGQIFELNTYLTGEINLKKVTANQIYNQYAGRPDWNRIGKKIGDEFPDDDIGVFLCGPATIGHQLSAMCKKLNPPPASIRNQRVSDMKHQRRFMFFKENF